MPEVEPDGPAQDFTGLADVNPRSSPLEPATRGGPHKICWPASAGFARARLFLGEASEGAVEAPPLERRVLEAPEGLDVLLRLGQAEAHGVHAEVGDAAHRAPGGHFRGPLLGR